MGKVYFATNRMLTGAAALVSSYGDQITASADPTALLHGVAQVQGAALANDMSGTIAAIDDVCLGGFSEAARRDIIESDTNLMVFLHGFCNSFIDSITRAAYNQAWFAASGVAAARTTVLAFSWPSLGKPVAAPPHLLPDDYRHDQGMALNSGAHVMEFLRLLQPVLQEVRARGRRCFLLAHSMGNYVLQSAVQSWFARGLGATTLFDEAILAAADERDDSFAQPTHGRLSNLPDLAERITIYHSVRDVAMYLSLALNLIERIGFEGPDDKSDLIRFPPERFRIADAACVDDYDLLIPPDASHQYYWKSPKIREDIVAVMSGTPRINPTGPFRL